MKKWTKQELRLALALYCQLPFGRLHSKNPEIVRLSKIINRTPAAVSMKLVNFASLDPAIVNSGRKGLGNASNLDKQVWDEFQRDWENSLINASKNIEMNLEDSIFDDSETSKPVTVEVRTKQSIFRRMILSNYSEKCCVSGLSDSRLLIASHIKPWSFDRKNRLNPKNGLCLSVLHDKAFDRGLITILPNFEISVSKEVKQLKNDKFAFDTLVSKEGIKIDLPDKFYPSQEFLEWHNSEVFLH